MRRPSLLVPLFFLTALFFGWKTYEAWTAPPQAMLPAPAAPVATQDPVASVVPPAEDPSSALAAIVARPLFRSDRRPFQENAAVVPRRNYESELSRFTVLGVLLLGTTEMAVVTGKTGSREERYEVGPGDTLPGFTVKEIQPDGVLVSADDKEFTLPLYAGAPKAPAGGALRTEIAAPARPAAAGPPSLPAFPGVGAATPSRPVPSPAARQPQRVPVASQPQSAPSPPVAQRAYPAPTSATYAPESATYAPESGPAQPVFRRTPARR